MQRRQEVQNLLRSTRLSDEPLPYEQVSHITKINSDHETKSNEDMKIKPFIRLRRDSPTKSRKLSFIYLATHDDDEEEN